MRDLLGCILECFWRLYWKRRVCLTPSGIIRLTPSGKIKMIPVDDTAGEFFCSFENPCPGTAGFNVKYYKI